MSNSYDKLFGFKKLLIVFIILYIVTLVIRLYGIQNDNYQADEHHWVDRSRGVIERFNKGDYLALTSHLDHPGIPPAILMAIGQSAAASYNSFHGLRAEDPFFIDALTGSRVMIALVSSLVVPLIFYFILKWFGVRMAVVVSLLCAFDPIHVGLSREAHLDSILTLFIVWATFLFIASERNKKLSTRFAAGAFWGLAMATKVSAIGFLIALAFYRFFTFAVWISSKKRINLSFTEKPVLIYWGDIGAILVGHLMLTAIYTRLWTKQFGYSVLKRVSSSLATDSYNFASWLRSSETVGAKLVIILAVICFVLGLYLAIRVKRQHRGNNMIFHGAMALLSLATVVIVHFLVPSLIDNFIRLYIRILWLKDVPHYAYGHATPAIPYGYLFIIFNRLTLIALVGLVLSLLLLLKKQWRRLLWPDHERGKILLIMLVIAVIWIGTLSASPKKTIRYIMPVVPVLYLISALGWQAVFFILNSYYYRQIDKIRKVNFRFVNVGCYSLVFFQLGIALSFAPDYIMHYSPFFGGLRGNDAKNIPFPIVGQEEIIRFLDSQPRGNFVERKVKVIGDHEMLKATAARLSRFNAMPIRFMPQYGRAEGYYLVVYWSFLKNLDAGYLNKVLSTPLSEGVRIFDYYFKGVNIASVFSFPMASLEKPIYFNFDETIQGTGRREYFEETNPSLKKNKRRVVTAIPGRDQKGYVALNHEMIIRAGEFKLAVLMGIPANIEINPKLTANNYAVRIELTKDCQKMVTLGELSQKRLQWIEINCRAEQSRDYRFRTYWFGNVPVVLSKIRLSR